MNVASPEDDIVGFEGSDQACDDVLDATAVSLCMENDLPIIVFDLNKPQNVTRAALGEPVGTLISGGATA